MKRRFFSIALVIAVLCGMICVVPSASAVTPWEHYCYYLQQSFFDFFGVPLDIDEFVFPLVGSCTEEDLLFAQDRYNSWFAGALRNCSPLGSAFDSFFNLHRAVIVEDKVNNRRRLQDGTTGEWIVDYNGQYPYVPIQSNDAVPDWATRPAPDCPTAPEIAPKSGNSWLELAPIQARLKSGALSGNTSYNYKQLTDLLNGLRERFSNVNYRLAPIFGGSYGVCKNNLVLCDSAGRPFIAFKEESSSAANQNQNVYIKNDGGGDLVMNGDKVTTDIKILDKSENTLTIPVTNDNSTNITIDDFIHQDIYDTSYNFDDHSYTVNTYDVTYNNDNRQYTTNYYTWNITYNITNTYVTYIGSNEAYQKEYEFYYELPDGRSSADLTADEIAAMSFQFADVMNYQRSATDTNLRALYHFDGDTTDSGFFNQKTAFTWQSGASITYMDSGVFDGALYLDDSNHAFDIMLSSGINSNSDFSVQFRYYQASEPDTTNNVENSLSLSGTTVLKWDERRLYSAGGQELCLLPLGNWIELALIRHNGTLYFYLNGVKVSTLSGPGMMRQISFSFGTSSRAYSMLDELRVIDFARATDGVSYTPSAVPYDTNLVLTLPGEEAVVDEYWQYTSPNNLFERPLFTDDGDYISFPVSNNAGVWSFQSGSGDTTSVSLDNSCLMISGGSSPSYSFSRAGGSTIAYGFAYQLRDTSKSSSKYAPGISSSTRDLTFSVVTTDGMIYSLPFTFLSGKKEVVFDWGRLVYCSAYGGDDLQDYFILVVPSAGKSISIAYMELVVGSTAQVKAEHITTSYDLTKLKPNTAAVQTDIPVHGYTVGGVRPTFPVRGDVWFGVTNGRVSTVQVYTGSAWTSSNARWWTGERWIPIYAFDIFTLEDCWDIADGDDVITPIESDTAGWNWWKKAWTDFRSWLGGVFGGGTPVEPSPSPSPTPTPSPSPSGPVIDDRPLMLASGVSIVRENTETWEAVNAASVKITLERGDLWSSSNTVKNLFVVDLMNGATSDDLFVSLDIDGLPAHEYPQWDVVSFLLYGNDDNYAAVRKASHFDGFSTAVEVFGGCQETHGNSADNNVTSATFALHKRGNQVRVFARPLDGEWQEGETLTVDFTVNKIGFCGWRYNDLGQTATFSNLRISTASRYGLVEDTDTMLTSFVANTSVVPFFLGGGFSVVDDGSSGGVPGDGNADRDGVKNDTLVDEKGNKVSVFGLMGKVGSALWTIVVKLFSVVFGGVLGFFKLITDSVGGFFGIFDDGLGLVSRGGIIP